MKYYIIAGEASGDLLGAHLIQALRRLDPQAQIRFWGGDRMAALAGTPVRHIRQLAIMGFIEVALHLRTILRNIRLCKQDILQWQPDALIGIDYPGFNLRIEKWAHQRHIRTIHYVSPQLWAWKKGRLKNMRKYLDSLCYILPFEQQFFARNHMPQATYVGHPLLDAIAGGEAETVENTQHKAEKTIALLPGSRKQEIRRTLPYMIHLARRHPEYHFAVAGLSIIGKPFYDKHIPPDANITVLYDQTYPLLASAHAAIVCSGTATLETALLDVPQVVCYRANPISIAIARKLVGQRVNHIALVDLIDDSNLVTELLQQDLNHQRLEQEFQLIANQPDNRQRILDGYRRVRQKLGGPGASLRAAQTIIDTIKQNRGTENGKRVTEKVKGETDAASHLSPLTSHSSLPTTLLLFLALILNLAASGQQAPLNPDPSTVSVRLYSNSNINTLNISLDLGAYNLYVDNDHLLEDIATDGPTLTIRAKNNQLQLTVGQTDYGTFQTIRLQATDTACILCLNPQGTKQRTYEGNLEIKPYKNNNLLIINHVQFETYIAGVVQSEIYGKHTDIFRIQAIISRTWALRNIRKHQNDGYNFCDQVHCQAYLNRCIRPDIMLGAIQSTGQTLVDSQGHLIETPFHSNSGGQTANSEDVWRTPLPYLRSVTDTFSFRMRQSDWTKTVPTDRWLNYFATKHRLNTNDPAIRDSLLHFSQPTRKVRLLGIPLTRIRVDFQLKSTFFSVTPDSATNNILIHGHGYGHGVGLSQEGAIRMVSLGIPYDSVLHHYYTGSILHLDPNPDNPHLLNYISQIQRIIEEDKNTKTQTHSKQNDWLGRLFRLRDREAREEIYIEEQQDNEKDWQYDW